MLYPRNIVKKGEKIKYNIWSCRWKYCCIS